MNTFTIDTNNRVAVYAEDVTVARDTLKFASDEELATVTTQPISAIAIARP
jgi:hypothetical protein